jgi:hypothetical protein
MKAIRATVQCNPACAGCTFEVQSIPRTLQTRQVWVEFSPACDAEQRQMREAARASHVERNRIRALAEEFT